MVFDGLAHLVGSRLSFELMRTSCTFIFKAQYVTSYLLFRGQCHYVLQKCMLGFVAVVIVQDLKIFRIMNYCSAWIQPHETITLDVRSRWVWNHEIHMRGLQASLQFTPLHLSEILFTTLFIVECERFPLSYRNMCQFAHVECVQGCRLLLGLQVWHLPETWVTVLFNYSIREVPPLFYKYWNIFGLGEGMNDPKGLSWD